MIKRYEKLQYLIDLQLLYNSKIHLDQLIQSLPEEKEADIKTFEAIEAKYQSEKDKHRKLLTDQHASESDVQLHESMLDKKQAQLHAVKTNKEYETTLHEIEMQKKMISDGEETILLLMDQVSGQEELLAKMKDDLAKKKALHDERLLDLEQKLEAAKTKLADVDPKIEKKETLGVPDTLALFHRLIANRGGRAVVEVVKGTCSACHASLIPNQVELIKSGQQIEKCEYCDRMLYFSDEALAQMEQDAWPVEDTKANSQAAKANKIGA
jgi:uncharacterized protein